jgi:lysophospholipase L1-like esterase
MTPLLCRTALCALLAAALLPAGSAVAALPDLGTASSAAMATPGRWDAAFADFAAQDQASPPPAGGVVFVGSSSIRLWQDLEQQFRSQPVVIKRGFGGSRLSDCVANLNRLVIRYRPRTVVLYAGDNDIAAGASPADVLHRFEAFADGVRAALPGTRIGYVSIKPSPARVGLMPAIREANQLIHAYIGAHAGLDYIDVYTPMLDAAGQPRGELFRADRLHLNARGYALWHEAIAPFVRAGGPAVAQAPR